MQLDDFYNKIIKHLVTTWGDSLKPVKTIVFLKYAQRGFTTDTTTYNVPESVRLINMHHGQYLDQALFKCQITH